ncbi:MAG: hypothetical protein OCU18_08545, partial [Candidatus Syntrophoarchaeum sp.]|nr:hypothetical protein [Candidatus Syntrophoarchaeum sp.]
MSGDYIEYETGKFAPVVAPISVDSGLTCFDHEILTVTDSVTSLTSGTYLDATRAEMTLETAQIRYWIDGTDPTSSQGHPVNPGDLIILDSASQIANFKA